MSSVLSIGVPNPAESTDLSVAQWTALVQSKDATIQTLQQQMQALEHRLKWFERQVFGSKSERYVPQPDPTQMHLGEVFPVPQQPREARKAVPAHTRRVPQGDMAAEGSGTHSTSVETALRRQPASF